MCTIVEMILSTESKACLITDLACLTLGHSFPIFNLIKNVNNSLLDFGVVDIVNTVGGIIYRLIRNTCHL